MIVLDGSSLTIEQLVAIADHHEPVTLAVEVNVLEDLGAVRLEAAVHVVKLDPGREARGRVVDPRDEPAPKPAKSKDKGKD